MSLPRIITVDPTRTVSTVIRSALDLVERSVTQVDVLTNEQAMQELSYGCSLIVMAFEIDDDTKGFELAARVKRDSPDTSVIVMGDFDDPDEFDEETAAESPFVYLSRPIDPHRFLRVLIAGLDGEDMKAALTTSTGSQTHSPNTMGPVPALDINKAQETIDTLLIDVGAMAIILANRTGDLLIESGAVGYLNREQLTQALVPAVLTGIDVKDMVGGQLYTVQFFDGDDFDVFVLSVGLHHFLCAVFDGQSGSRQFGVVNRYGRRAVEDLIALIGANAFFVQSVPVEEQPRKASKRAAKQKEEEVVPLAPAEFGDVTDTEEAEALQLDPIEADEDELAQLFSDGGEGEDDWDSMFDEDELSDIANQQSQNLTKGKLDWDDAMRSGALKR